MRHSEAPVDRTGGRYTTRIPVPYAPLIDERAAPKPADDSGTSHAYFPALDGLRAVAVLAVMLYHHVGLGSSLIGRGGYIGVDIFFVLSGYLITSLLIVERRATGRIALGRFWGRRARRLLPALLLTLVFVGLLTQFVYSAQLGALVHRDMPYVLLYVQNWHVVFRPGVDAPIGHLWSLSVEEQWYLLWPMVFAGLWKLTTGRLRWLAAILGALAVGSAVLTAMLFAGGNIAHAYYGTDVRAQELLVGAVLAVVGSGAGLTIRTRSFRMALDAAALTVLVALAGVVAWADPESFWYDGGWLLLAVSTAIVITAAVQPDGWTRSFLALPPLVAVGRISYGLYLFHFPAYAWIDESMIPARYPRLFVQVVVTFGLATFSYFAVERPIRNRRIPTVAALAIGSVAVAVALTLTTVGVGSPLRAPRSKLLAFALIQVAKRATPRSHTVLLVGGQRAASLRGVDGGIYTGNGIYGFALGIGGCGVTIRTRACRAIPDDLAALARAFPAQTVVLMPDPADITGFTATAPDRARVRRTLDSALVAVGRSRLLVLSATCVVGEPPGGVAFDSVVQRWSEAHRVRVTRLPAAACAANAPSDATWQAVAGAVGPTRP